MGDWLWAIAQYLATAQSAMTAPANPSQTQTQAEVCTGPRYSYGPWEKTGEDRWYEGQWVMEQIHYQRTKTDICDGSETIERKTEGPFRLWQASPDRRVAGVNHPYGVDDFLEGAPQRSSSLPADPNGGSGPGEGSTSAGQPPQAPKGQDKEPSPYLPSLALLLGVGVAWFGRSRAGSSKVPGTGKSAGNMLWDFLWKRGMPWLSDHQEQVDRAGNWLSRAGDAIGRGWNKVRSNPVGWVATEVLRRVSLIGVGLIYFVGTTIQSLAKLLVDGAVWVGKGLWTIVSWPAKFTFADTVTRREMTASFSERWLTKDSWLMRWESAQFFGAMFVASIVETWQRFFTGVKRLFRDPDMSADDLIQLGDDTASVFFDVLIVAEGAGAVTRAVRGASWFGRGGRLSEFGKLSRLDQFAEAHRIAGVLQQAGAKSVTTWRVWRVLKAVEKEAELAKLLSQLPPKYHNTIWALMEMGFLQWEGGKLRGVAGTIRPWKLARAIASGQAKDVDNLLNQVMGGLGEQVVRKFMEAEPGFKDFLLDFGHSSEPGLDALAEFHNRFVAVEVKHWSSTVGLGNLKKYFEVVDGITSFKTEQLLEEITTRMTGANASPAQISRVTDAILAGRGEFVFRLEIVGVDASATGPLRALNGKILNGIKIEIHVR